MGNYETDFWNPEDNGVSMSKLEDRKDLKPLFDEAHRLILAGNGDISLCMLQIMFELEQRLDKIEGKK